LRCIRKQFQTVDHTPHGSLVQQSCRRVHPRLPNRVRFFHNCLCLISEEQTHDSPIVWIRSPLDHTSLHKAINNLRDRRQFGFEPLRHLYHSKALLVMNDMQAAKLSDRQLIEGGSGRVASEDKRLQNAKKRTLQLGIRSRSWVASAFTLRLC